MPTVFLYLSLIANIVVLLPVTSVLVFDAPEATRAWGPKTDARQILLAIYLTILAVSTGLLLRPDSGVATGLLTLQIIYKTISPLTVGNFCHPVVVVNLGIAALHSVTMYLLLTETAK